MSIYAENEPIIQLDGRRYSRWRQFSLAVLLSTTAVFQAISLYCLSAFFPQIALSKGAQLWEVGLVYGLFQLIVMACSPVFGYYIVPRIGTKFMLCAGSFLTGGANVVFGWVNLSPPDPTFILLCYAVKIVQAAGHCLFKIALNSTVVDVFRDSRNVDTMIGLVSAAFDLGMAVSPWLGGIFYDLSGFGLPFYLTGGLLIGIMALNALLLPPSSTHGNPSVNGGPGYLKLLGDLRGITFVGMISIGIMAPSFFHPTLETHLLKEGSKLTNAQVGQFFLCSGLSTMVSSLLAGVFINRYGRAKELMIGGAVLSLVGCIFVGPAPFLGIPTDGSSALWCTAAAMVTVGLGNGLQFVPVFGELLITAGSKGFPVTDARTQGMVSAVFQSSMSLGLFIGATGGAALVQRIGFDWTATAFGLTNLSIGIALAMQMILSSTFAKKKSAIAESTQLLAKP